MSEDETIDNNDSDEALYEINTIDVDPGQQLLRIDKFLSDKLIKATRNKIQTAIANGLITVNDASVKTNYKVRPGDTIKVYLPKAPQEFTLEAEDIPINIVYEDNDIVVINKDAGMVVHPGHGNYTGTLVNALLHDIQQLGEGQQIDRPGLVHRLDKNTSGIMVVAKTDEALSIMSKQFFHRTTERTYNALVWGDVKEDEGTIEGAIGRDLKNRKIMRVFPDGDYGKEARTHYKVLERFGYVTLVECKLDTGRTHQIRVHFKYINHPLFGDVEYGGNRILKGTKFSRYKQFVENNFKL